MPDQPPYQQSNQSYRQQGRGNQGSRGSELPEAPPTLEAPFTSDGKAKPGSTGPGAKMGELKVTPGAAGARSVALEKFWQPVGNALPCGFKVTTTPGHGLEVIMEQQAYKKAFTGIGSLTTTVTPVAPIGTPGKITARDTTTGEVVEQPWTWHIMSQSSASGLWAFLMRLLGKS
jgi:hypothetical protein